MLKRWGRVVRITRFTPRLPQRTWYHRIPLTNKEYFFFTQDDKPHVAGNYNMLRKIEFQTDANNEKICKAAEFACQALQSMHPHLRSVIQDNHFVSTNKPIPLRIVRGNDDSAIKDQILDHDFRVNFDLSNQVPLSVQLFLSPTHKFITMIMHHAICDGLSFTQAARRFMEFMIQYLKDETQLKLPAPRAVPVHMWDLLPEFKLTGMVMIWSNIKFVLGLLGLVMQSKPLLLNSVEYGQKRFMKRVKLCYSMEETKGILQLAHSFGSTVTALFIALFSQAVSTATGSAFVSSAVTADMRQNLKTTNASLDDLIAYQYGVIISLKDPTQQSIEKMSKQIKSQIQHGATPHYMMTVSQNVCWLVTTFGKMTDTRKPSVLHFSFANLGVISDFPCEPAVLTSLLVDMNINMSSEAPQLFIQAFTINGQLSLNVNFSNVVNETMVQQIVNEVHEQIVHKL